jgi:acyl-CoA hydrolase
VTGAQRSSPTSPQEHHRLAADRGPRQGLAHQHGAFDLRAKSSDERALGLIGIAHPAFRERLLAEARRLNLVG